MKKLSTYIIVMFTILYWGFRVVLTLAAQLGRDILGIVPLNLTFEIILLFAYLLCIILIVKRKMIGAVLYLTLYGVYFGGDITAKIGRIINGEILGTAQMGDLFFSIIAIVLTLAVLIDLLLDKGRKEHPVDKKTDWFYKNEKFDREMDERADKNNYRTM